MKNKKILIFGTIIILMLSFISTSSALFLSNEYKTEKTEYNNARNSPVFCELITDSANIKGIETMKIIQDIYESGEYSFNYVTVLSDVSNEASNELLNKYNIVGSPTCIFQGGYDTLYDVDPIENTYKNIIATVQNRYIPNLEIDLEKKWIADCCSAKAIFTITVTNNEAYTYRGFLKLYVSEIESRWNYTYENEEEPFNHALLDIPIEKQITIEPNSNITIEETWIATPFTPKSSNLKATAFVANALQYTGYSDPPANEHSFIAYYIDKKK